MNTLTDQTVCRPQSGAVSGIRTLSARATGWALVALGVTLPLATSGTSILIGLILLLWIVGGNYRETFLAVRRHPLAVASLVLFGLYLLGLFYGNPGSRVAFDVSRFLLLALFIPLFTSARLRQQALWAFSAAAIVLLTLSYLAWLQLMPQIAFLPINPVNVVIQDRITYGLFVTVAAYFWAIEAFFCESRNKRAILLILVALAVFNLLAVVNSMTAYVILPTLFSYFFISRWRWKGVIAFALAVALIMAITLSFPANPLYQRIAGAVTEFTQWRPDEAQTTNVGGRLEFYHNALKMIRERPLFGVGVGGFADAYAKQIRDRKMVLTDNPHNEYLLTAAQVGLVGLAALLYLFFTQWRLARLLPTRQGAILARGVVLAFVVGCLFNSFLTDFDEGVFFIWISALLFSGVTPVSKGENA
jgi:O-antigen ligase